jgi:hypothetical protein
VVYSVKSFLVTLHERAAKCDGLKTIDLVEDFETSTSLPRGPLVVLEKSLWKGLFVRLWSEGHSGLKVAIERTLQ